MKVHELIEMLNHYDPNKDIKIVVRASGCYEITGSEIGNFWDDYSRCPEYVRLIASNWDVKIPAE